MPLSLRSLPNQMAVNSHLIGKAISITNQKINPKHNSLLISIQAYPIGRHRKQDEQTKAKGPAILDHKASSASSIQDKKAWQKGTISHNEAEDHDNWIK